MIQRYQNENNAFTSAYFSQYNNTITNGEARIPICFCIDTSASMRFVTNPDDELEYTSNNLRTVDGVQNVHSVRAKPGFTIRRRIDEVQRVLRNMLDRMRRDSRITNAVAICIITFDRWADCAVEFSDVNAIPVTAISGIETGEEVTNASSGISMALSRIEQFRRMNSQAGNESYRPILVFMSDGSVSADPNANAARREVREQSENNKLNVVPIGIGHSADEGWMRQMSKDAYVYHMDRQEEFDRVFELINKRVDLTTKSLPTDEGFVERNTLTEETLEEDVIDTSYGTSVDEDLKFFMDEMM